MTLAEKAYQMIRRDIVRGTLEPSRPLRLEQLRQRYGVGFSPLREALNRLQSERLVVSVALRGFSVSPLSLAEMWDAIETRILIEARALRLSIENGDDDWEGRIVAGFHALSLQAKRSAGGGAGHEADQLEARHKEFHLALISACGSPRLLEYSERLYIETERYRIPALLRLAPLPGRDLTGEHGALMEATLARDSDAAVDLLDRHYRRTGSMLDAHFSAVLPAAE